MTPETTDRVRNEIAAQYQKQLDKIARKAAKRRELANLKHDAAVKKAHERRDTLIVEIDANARTARQQVLVCASPEIRELLK